MTEQQQRFYVYIMERVEEKNQAKATELIEECFARLGNGTFTPDFKKEYMQKMMDLIKHEHRDEVKYIIQNFRP
ncbi:MAG: hypothetical protein PUC65_11150 [Clostridiales bacterium]|nr:hypothetical protein [Clostridiales bacterium]